MRQTIEHICQEFDLTEEERRKSRSCGQPIIDNRVGWARTYLKKAGLLDYTKRGHFKITDRGIDILRQRLPEINVEYLSQFPEFVEFRSAKKERDKSYT